MPRGGFQLTKWYIDCLDRDGGLVILYWASLQWRRLRVSWHSVARFAPGVRPVTRSSVVQCAAPTQTSTETQWASARLNCDAQLQASNAGIGAQHFAEGVEWSCSAPGARAQIRVGDVVYRGLGYAEKMELSVRPWSLGIRQLRWGRWISNDAARGVVWIEWNQSAGQRWVFVDGARSPSAALSNNSVTANGARLDLDAPTVLVDRGLNRTIGRIPGLRAVAPRWLTGGHELRRTRTGTLHEGTRVTQGTAVDEVVEFG